MTEYAVTVEYTGDFMVDADSPEEAREHVVQIMDYSTPDSDWYFRQVVDVREET